MPKHGGVWKVTQLSFVEGSMHGCRDREQKVARGRKVMALGTHILLDIVPLYFFWVCLGYFFLHLYLCEEHPFL